MRAHFGCIFKYLASSKPLQIAQRDFGVCVLCAYNGHLCDLGGEKQIRATMRMVMAMAMCGFMRS
jgi:hypothetical protein